MESKQLAKELKQAKDYLEALKQERDQRRRKLVQERVLPLEQQIMQIKRKIDAEVTEAFPYADFDAADSKVRILERQLNEAKANESRTHDLVGQKVQRWARSSSWGRNTTLIPKEMGIVDVYDGQNIGGRNASWRKPVVGQLFIRNIKKDGKPGLNTLATVPGDLLPGGWYLEGVDPNKQTNV